jgi:hypothetical protein
MGDLIGVAELGQGGLSGRDGVQATGLVGAEPFVEAIAELRHDGPAGAGQSGQAGGDRDQPALQQSTGGRVLVDSRGRRWGHGLAGWGLG